MGMINLFFAWLFSVKGQKIQTHSTLKTLLGPTNLAHRFVIIIAVCEATQRTKNTFARNITSRKEGAK
jgi:hypothetical protein